jgi:Domain of unknown function (DUF4136)
MKIQRVLFATTGIVFLVGAMALADVKIDYDRSANFSQYKTYSWETVQAGDPLWVGRIKEAVDSQLAAKGWRRVESGGQASIIAIGITTDQRTLHTFYDDFGGGWRWGMSGEATTTVETYTVGTLVIDIFDTSAKKLIWRGSATDTVSDKSDKNIENLHKDVQKMFEHFPPEVKG